MRSSADAPREIPMATVIGSPRSGSAADAPRVEMEMVPMATAVGSPVFGSESPVAAEAYNPHYFEKEKLVKDDQIIVIDCILNNIPHFMMVEESDPSKNRWFVFQAFLN